MIAQLIGAFLIGVIAGVLLLAVVLDGNDSYRNRKDRS